MLTILHTNDLHGGVGMLPRLAALIARERARGGATLLIDAGDAGLGGPLADLGVALLAGLGYDVLTPGNAETDLPEHRAALCRVGAPIVVANVTDGDLGGHSVPFLMREADGIRVALLGLTTTPVYPRGHPLYRPRAEEVAVSDAGAAAAHWVPVLRARADLVVVISHLGLRRDIALAQTVPGIDLIIGGHSHHRLPSLLRIGTTHIAQAGVAGAYLGIVAVTRSPAGLRLAGRLAPVWHEPVDAAWATTTTRAFLRQQLPDRLSVVSETTGCWADPWTENTWANVNTDALQRAADADACIVKAAAILPALDPGPATIWDLERGLPMLAANEEIGADGVVAMTLTGAALRAVCEHSVGDQPRDLADVVPAGFCWPGNNLLHVAGLRLAVDLARPLGGRVTALTVGGTPVAENRQYRVVTTGFLARGYSGFHWLRNGADQQVVGTERAIAMAALRASGRLPALDGRLQFLGRATPPDSAAPAPAGYA